jgi:ABC-type multidrug transport system ATPase subunit
MSMAHPFALSSVESRDAALEATNVVKRVADRPVLAGVGLAVLAGELVLIGGEPGAGRTTLLRCLTGISRPDAGSVILYGDGGPRDLAAADDRTLDWLHRRAIRLVDGRLAAPPRATLSATVARPVRRLGLAVADATARASEALQLVGLDQESRTPVGELDRAERLAADLAIAVALQPDLVVVEAAHLLNQRGGTSRLRDVLQSLRRSGGAVVAAVDIAGDGPASLGADGAYTLRDGILRPWGVAGR